ncbi:MAG: NPCBM/NEW2 domain-containing protein, partial [Oscillospiraceae bacterium]
MSRKNFVKHFGTALLATLVLLFGADAFGFCSCAVQATSAPSQEVYLSDLAWESATHGDQANYQVFKDQTFTSGNKIGGEQPLKKISLLVNGVETEFNKGLSTCASSVIVYNLSGKNAIKFSTYIGVDYAKMGSYTSTIGNPEDQRGGIVNSIQVLVDDVELYNSNGQVNPSMNATLVSVDIPSNATKLTLKCEQGFKNWGDEVDYADAKLTIAQPVNSGTDLQLSDIAWESATHGDQANYQVFKDQTFTSGNKIGGEQPL